MLPSCFDYIFVHSRQKARPRPELARILSTLGPNQARTRPEKSGPTYNSTEMGPQTGYMFQRNTASITKDLISSHQNKTTHC